MKRHMLPIGLASILLTVATGLKAVVIDAGSVSDGSWSYSLSYDDLVQGIGGNGNGSITGGDNKFFNDVETSSNMQVFRTNNGGSTLRATLGMTSGATLSSFTYKFDFSSSGYAISGFTATEPWRAEIEGNTGTTLSYTSWYSLTGEAGSWIQINTSGARTGYAAATGTSAPETSVTLSDASILWYKVELTSSNPVNIGTGIPRGMLFGYVNNGSADAFGIDFNLTAVPEPSTVTIILGSCGLLVATVLRNRRK